MSNSSIFLFQSEVYKNTKSGDYNLYLFKDFTGDEGNIQKEVFGVLDKEVRRRIHPPETIYIICREQSHLNKEEITSRFFDGQAIEYIDYQDVCSDIFKHGISEIVTKNKVIQPAPYGTRFKKTSGKESDYFIKASLSLLEYPEICFIALATYQKITPSKLLPLKKIYVDTSSIISLIQAVIYCYNMLEDTKLNPQIINFKSYSENDINFNIDDSFTIISASSSGDLKRSNEIDDDKCLTLFLQKNENQEEECLFQLDNSNNQSVCDSPRLIALISEDFSLTYSKSKEVIIKKSEVEKLDSKKLIKKILDDEFKTVDYDFYFDEIRRHNCIKFDNQSLYRALKDNKFIEDTFSRAFSLEKDNYIIYDFKNPRDSKTNIKAISKTDFLDTSYSGENIKNKNIVVFLAQAKSYELINISQKLRKYKIINITYIIGVLITDNFQESETLENNICFNDTDYKYDFYCYLNLPLLGMVQADIDSRHNLSNGFVFYEGQNSQDLNPKAVYLVVCLILELLRSNHKLSDNISHHNVLSPKNFSRFNDSLLQLSLLKASKGRELNFHSNIELSREMKGVIMDLMREKESVGKVFIVAVKNDQIKLTKEDSSTIKNEHSSLFENEI